VAVVPEVLVPVDDLPISTPEPIFAARVAPPEADRALPSMRRAIFFDVENSSRPEHIAHVIEHLAMDRRGSRTEFIAVGNWKVVSPDTARLLAQQGAHLIHSAPSTGVRDWSDLRIAVGAGVWLAAARPGDMVEIVSDDRAFDAVGDVAASLGIRFRRLSYRGLAGMPGGEPPPREVTSDAASRRRRGRRRGGWRGPSHVPQAAHPAPRVHVPAAVPVARPEPPPLAEGEEPATPHTAPHEEIVNVVRDLIGGSASGGVTIDALANALKSRGFSRTPGSPRLITRLRRIREISVNRAGLITLTGGADGRAHEPRHHEPRHHEPRHHEPRPPEPRAHAPREDEGPAREPALREPAASVAEAVAPGAREAASAIDATAAAAEPAGPPGEPEPGGEGAPAARPRRRSRRGGRGRRRRPESQPAPTAS
jgi:hypothetical protein